MLYKIKSLSNFDMIIGASLAFIVKIIAAVGAFLLNILIAQLLGAEQAGYFFLAQAVIFIIAAIARQGFDNALVKFIAGYRAVDNQVFISGIYQYALAKIVPVLIVFSVAIWLCSDVLSVWFFSKPLLSPILSVSALVILPLSISQLHGFCLQGQKQVVLASTFQSAAMAVLSLIIIYALQPNSASEAMLGYAGAGFIVFLFSIFVWNYGRKPKLFLLPIEEKKHITDSVKPLFVILLLAQITQWSGQLMLGAWNSTTDVAIFATAQRTAMLTSFILIAVNSIAAPKFAEAFKKNDIHSVKNIAKFSGQLMTIVSLPVIIIMLLFSEKLMGLFGEDFIQGANILRVLALGQFVNVITGSVGYLLQMTGHENILRNNVIISSLIMLVGGFIVIPVFGVYGAALISAFSVATQNLLCVYQVKKMLGFNTLNIFRS
ncbi:oligosaccharide flippase family protein [Photobacterium sp. DA100]|uniref:oligosaccharide flippase family protein n=1 Tax=Photobacterium sp. DA100 TaxID=3027472 RepID=UPI002478D938|nr:oligosaccharide flippase family protein [Photobacterium sp. DA100]WEM41568.1 oligosaccharide flippase family protein [Photobacterium sp. DA100]